MERQVPFAFFEDPANIDLGEVINENDEYIHDWIELQMLEKPRIPDPSWALDRAPLPEASELL